MTTPTYPQELTLRSEPLGINVERGTNLAKKASLSQALHDVRAIKETLSSQEQSVPGVRLKPDGLHDLSIEVYSLNGEDH